MSTAPLPADPVAERTGIGERISSWNIPILGWVGIGLTTLVLAIALIGPFFAPHDPDALLGLPFGPPQDGFPLGFDYLGRDAFSRFLSGGRGAVVIAVLGYLLGAAIGLSLGLLGAYVRGRLDSVVAWLSEVLIGFPALVLMLLLVAGLGSDLWVVAVALAVVNVPRVLRIVRAAALDVRDASFVEVAQARGEPRRYVMFREIFPHVLPPFLVDAGIRIPASILLVASLSFLGLGIQPPSSDWGLTISENRAGLTIQPWAVVGPIAALALLMVGVNLALDAVQGRRSLVSRRRVE